MQTDRLHGEQRPDAGMFPAAAAHSHNNTIRIVAAADTCYRYCTVVADECGAGLVHSVAVEHGRAVGGMDDVLGHREPVYISRLSYLHCS